MISLQIVDDHQILTDGLQQLLTQEADFDCLPPLHSGEALMTALKQKTPDVLLLDVNLPDTSGLILCKKITKQYPSVKVIMLTMFKKASFLQQAMRNGAVGYLLKDAGITEIQAAIRAVYRGEKYVSPAAAALLVDSLTNPNAATDDFTFNLSRREKQVLQLIAREYTSPEIAAELFISENTVESHRRNLLFKLNARNVAGMVRTAVEKGLLE
ncbi:MAG: response regulator transcription factor [Bacteroidota bacterium]